MTTNQPAYGAGSMSERPAGSGVWRLRVYLGRDPLTGRPVQRQSTFRGSKTKAQRELAKLTADAAAGKFDRTTASVGQLLDKWLTHIEPMRRPSTVAGYRAKIDHAIRPALGDVPLSKLTAAELDRLTEHGATRGLHQPRCASTTPSCRGRSTRQRSGTSLTAPPLAGPRPHRPGPCHSRSPPRRS